jgi:hypothetical protein
VWSEEKVRSDICLVVLLLADYLTPNLSQQ